MKPKSKVFIFPGAFLVMTILLIGIVYPVFAQKNRTVKAVRTKKVEVIAQSNKKEEAPKKILPDFSKAVPFPIPKWAPPKQVVSNTEASRLVTYNVKTKKITVSSPSKQDLQFPPSKSSPGRSGILSNQIDQELIRKVAPESFSNLEIVNNSSDPAWRMNCKLFMKYRNKPGTTFYGSGVLIDSKYLLTAAHLVYKHDLGGFADEVTVIPAYEDGVRPYDWEKSYLIHTWSGWRSNRNFDWDMSYIELTGPIGATTGYHGYAYDDNDTFFTTNIFDNPGYPNEPPYNGERMYNWWGMLDGTTTHKLFPNLA